MPDCAKDNFINGYVAVKAIVREIGRWPKSKKGFHTLPEFYKGQTVLIRKHAGQELRAFNDTLKLVNQDDVLAVLDDVT